MLSTMTEEEKRAWKEEQQRLGIVSRCISSVELEERKALEEGVLHGQRIAIDINYQEKMTTRVAIASPCDAQEQLSLVKQLCFAHNANKRAAKHISMHICGFISSPIAHRSFTALPRHLQGTGRRGRRPLACHLPRPAPVRLSPPTDP